MKSKVFSFRYFLVSIFILAFFFSFLKVDFSFAETNEETRARLQIELNELEKQIADQQKIISSTQTQSASLSRDISLLQSQINKKQLEIKKIDGTISSLTNQISNKSLELNELSNDLEKQKKALVSALKDVHYFDGTNNFVNLILDNKSISDFFEDADKIVSLQEAINKDVTDIKDTSQKVSKVREDLEDHKDTQIALKNEQKEQQKQISVSKTQKDTLLKETKGQEALYKKQLAEKQAKAAQIRSALFSFAGGNTAAIPFGDALKYAEAAQAKTGVPAAFVLAILTQESALGANVGKCYLSDTTSGAGYNINSKTQYTNVMKASRDVPPFLQITSRLGMDPLKTVVSCPIPSAGGYGGAMGPAQFIASTWQTVGSRVSAITGSSNPWGARDSITASSIYLSDLGASTSYASQIKAACKYYGSGGSSCSYGTSVMSKVSGIQQKIDYLKQYGQ
ncbi:MAG: hypothetical protein RI945_172 [Candidatus Parcubacteria bacterium]|jgi:peptidoglycan hydrolase CwlO-like protein